MTDMAMQGSGVYGPQAHHSMTVVSTDVMVKSRDKLPMSSQVLYQIL